MMPSPYRRPEWLCDDHGGPGVHPVAVALHRRLVAALGAGRCDEALRLMRELSAKNETARNPAQNTLDSAGDGC